MLENELFFGSLFWVILDRFWRQNGAKMEDKMLAKTSFVQKRPTLSKHWHCAYGLRVRASQKGVKFDTRMLQNWCSNPAPLKVSKKIGFGSILGAILTHFGGQNAPQNLYEKHSILEDFGSPGGGPGCSRRQRHRPSGDMGKWHLGLENDVFPCVLPHSPFYTAVPPQGRSIT